LCRNNWRNPSHDPIGIGAAAAVRQYWRTWAATSLAVRSEKFGTHAETQLAGHFKDPAGFDAGQLGFGVCPELAGDYWFNAL
jgi:hypothetical protein